MATLADQGAARPEFLSRLGWVLAGLWGLTCLPPIMAGRAGGGVYAFTALSAAIVAALFIAALVRTKRDEAFGHRLIEIEPHPLIPGEPFSGYAEMNSGVNILAKQITLAAIVGENEVHWSSADLSGPVEQDGGRQRIAFKGTLPNEPHSLWRITVALRTDRGSLQSWYHPAIEAASERQLRRSFAPNNGSQSSPRPR